ncbi:SDR family NAD(P)-dependent oxidoreductase [Actinoplanes sp. URMC 104]|uniref:SDR family NAD(P)-dependent oxidoreductase n=1 Tax=Actinoplanes sp. URMC 104 TaxID=3423409 RepID=UPI003F19ED1D
MAQLTGKIALVTGATSGIGRATAQRFVEEGAYVFVTGRRRAELDATVEALGANARGIPGDVSRLDDLDEIVRQIREDGRGLDVLFANAGGGSFATLEETTLEHFDDTFATNVRGTYFTVQKALPVLNPGASVVLTGSTAATSGTPAFGVYAASKAAIRSFARTWAVELAGRSIRVNVIVPGPTDTEGLRGLAPAAEHADALVKQLGAAIPVGRAARPEEIANAVVFLASDASSFVTGSELFADGGEEQQ